MSDKKQRTIFVTQPSLPPLEEFLPYLEDIWEKKWLTNNGHYHRLFEEELANFLGVKHVSLFCNGMMALQIGLQALRVTGEVITTPFSFVATTHAIHWNGCVPVFCDIEPETYTLDADKLESLITPRTTAILPVHVYGYPCDVDRLQKIADTYGLKLFYDAAHAFDVRLGETSVLNFGDLSMLSFHATKAFNTFEGGALITNDPKLKSRIDFLKNFGFADEVTVVAPGSNGKMNEFQSALGLLQLKRFKECVARRKAVADIYDEAFSGLEDVVLPPTPSNVQTNYSYYPILIKARHDTGRRDRVYRRLKSDGIMGRRYFYPLISDFPAYRHLPSAETGQLSVAAKVANEVLCLPIYPDLTQDDIRHVISALKTALAE